METDSGQLLAFLKSPIKWLKAQAKADKLFTERSTAIMKESSSSGTPRATVDRTSNQKTLDSEIIAAAGVGNTIRVKELLDAGADVHASAHAGWRDYYDDPGPGGNAVRSYDEPLKQAAENGHLETVRALLQSGAHVNSLNSWGQWKNGSAIERAAAAGQTEVVKLLILSGANVRINDDAALRVAAEKGHTDTVAALLAGGADVHARAALHMAAENGHVETVRALLQAGAHVNSSSRYTNSSSFIVTGSPIELAAAAGRTAVVKLLIDSETDKLRGYVAEADGTAAPERPKTASERLEATVREIEAEQRLYPKAGDGEASSDGTGTPGRPGERLPPTIAEITAENAPKTRVTTLPKPANQSDAAAPERPKTASERLAATMREIEADAQLEPTRPENAGRFRARGRDM